jgi:DNA-binding transcriptional MerR regulator
VETPVSDDLLTIGEMCDEFGVTPRTLRFYEARELISPIREGQKRLPDAAEQWRQVIRIRAAEPTGYLGLARVLVQQKDRDAASEVLQKLIAGSWEERFGDVKAEARELERKLGGRSF